jgi:hypothetical protein
MAVLTEGEILLRENIELQKGLKYTDEAFKELLLNSKQYQQMLRGINRQLAEHNTNYGKIREQNEQIFDTIFNYSKLLSSQKISKEFDNIYKGINKASDEFRDLNAQLQTGDVSLKEYKKSLSKLGDVEKSIERQKILLEFRKKAIDIELGAEKTLLQAKETALIRVGKKTKETLETELAREIRLKTNHATRIQGIQDRLDNTSYMQRYQRQNLINEIDNENIKLQKRDEKISKLQNFVNEAPTQNELTRLRDSVGDKESELLAIGKINLELDKSKNLTQETSEQFDKSLQDVKNIEKKIGNIGTTMGVLKKLGINKFFDFKSVEDAMKSAARMKIGLQLERKARLDAIKGDDAEAKEIAEKLEANDDTKIKVPKFGSVAGAGVSAMYREAKERISVEGGVVGGGIYLAKQILDLIFQFDERWREISKNQGMVRDDAVELLGSYQKMSKENKELDLYGMSIRKTAATQKELMDATLSISNALGVNYTIINKGEGDLIANIKERMGLGDDVRQSLLEGSLVANEGFEEYFNKILGVNAINRANNKFYMNDKALLTDMSKASSSIRLQFRNHSMDLANIVIDSKKYGANLQQLDGAMGGMLDWEKQLELQTSFFAQTGQLIDTSRLQYFSMYNDIENFQKEFDKLTGTAKEYEGLTRFAQQTKAEMFGMDREGYAQMLLEKELMKKINADETMKKQFDNRQTEIQMKKEYNALKEKGLSYEKIGEILGKNSQLLLSQQKSSDEFGRAIEKIKDTFASFVENEDIENLIQSVTSLITNMSEFLMEHADFLGIRTTQTVAKKYGEQENSITPSIGSINSPDALRSYHLDIKKLLLSKDPSISENAAKDVAVMIRKYDKLNNIPSQDAKKLDKYIFDMIYKSSGESTLPAMVEKFTKDFIDKKISELGSPITPNINLEKPPKSKFVKEIQDGMISPQGNIVIKTPVGDILPNVKDYIITTTNPSSLLSNNASQNITQYLIDETKMVSTMEMVKKAVEQQTIEIVKAFSQNRDVNLNGRKVGEMINMSNNRI